MSANVSQPAHPMLINLPQPPSNPDTPSEMPGTPTSTTTSLSALSTTAIKDGHRGTLPPHGHRGHHSNPSTNSLEAERADRISRLTGLSSVSRPNNNNNPNANNPNNLPGYSAQTTPTSSGFLPQHTTNNPSQYLTPAYFDAHGQPTAATKMSTVGTASASVSATTAQEDEDQDMGDASRGDEEDLQSMDTYGEEEGSAASYRDRDEAMMEEDRSVEGGYDDRMSDDGSASLVGFGEGAGSTVSGPIYHRRPIPGGGQLGQSSAGAMDRHIFGLDRRDSGFSSSGGGGGPEALTGGQGRRETVVGRPAGGVGSVVGVGGADTPVVPGAERERTAALQLDGMAVPSPSDHDGGDWVDTSARGPVPVTSAIRETQQPGSTSREAAERLLRERLGDDGVKVAEGQSAMESPQGEKLGRFYFEEKK